MATTSQNVQSQMENAGQKADSAMQNAASKASEMANKASEYAQGVAQKGSEALSDAQRRAAEAYESARDYVRDADWNHMAGDATQLVRRYPLAAVAVGFGLGMLLARLTSDR